MVEIIKGKLWLGDVDDANDLHFLEINNINTIICCAKELLYKVQSVVEVHYFLIDDDDTYINFDVIINLINQSNRVLVHCLAGINRSPTVVASYLIKQLKMNNAIEYIKKLKPDIDPNFTFLLMLEKLKLDNLECFNFLNRKFIS